MKRLPLVLLPVGPLAVALLRFLLPYYTAEGNRATARAVLAHPGRESAVLWLGLVAMLTLVPGLLTAAQLIPPSPLKSWALGLCIPGYLCLGLLLAQDALVYSGARATKDPQATAALLAATHPAVEIATGIFVVGHVLGTVLLGVALLRTTEVDPWAGWLVTVSQPLHFVAAVIVGSPVLDLIAWSMLAVGLIGVARTISARSLPRPVPSPQLLVGA